MTEWTEVVLRIDVAGEEAATALLLEEAPQGFRADRLPDPDAPGGRGVLDAPAVGDVVELGVYVASDEAAPLLAQLASGLAGRGVDVQGSELREVPDDYADRWQQFHEPVTIGRLWVGPSWHLPAPAGFVPVVIDPAQGFGTGAHATTRLVLGLLVEQHHRGSLLDIGCGSGVLAVAAAHLGFRPISAIDNDQAAVDSTRENMERNGVRFDVQLRDAMLDELPRADLVLANLTLEPLARILPRMRAPRVLASGLLRSQAADAADAAQAAGYVVRERRDRDGWVALVLDRADSTAEDSAHKVVL